MSVFDLYPDEAAAKLEDRHAVDLSRPPGWFEGSIASAPVTGVAAAGVNLARGLNLGLSHIPAAVDAAFGTETRDWWFKNMMGERLHRAVTPNARETGLAGQTLHALFDIGTQAYVGGPALVGISKTVSGAIEGIDEGLDAGTAMKKGGIEGAATAAGVAFPIAMTPVVGSRIPALVQQLGYGVAANVPLGIAQRGLTHEVLAKAGYKDMAEQYKALDEGALLTDLVMGMAFGGLGHVMQAKGVKMGDIRPSDIDAALTKRNAFHVEVDTAPGLARDADTRDAHVESVLKATQDLIEGRPVDISQTLRAAEFEPNPHVDAARAEIAAMIDKSVGMEARRTALELHDPAEGPLPGMVRMYHGASEAGGMEGARWFSSDPAYAQGYAEKSPDGRVYYVDVPADHPLIKPDYPEQSIAAGFHRNVELPAELSETRRLLEGVLTEQAAAKKGEALGGEKVALGGPPIEQVHAALKAEGIEPDAENVAQVSLIARARAIDAAAVDALPERMPDGEYLAKVKEIVDGHEKTQAADPNRQGAGEQGSRPAGGEAGQGEEGGQAARGSGGEAQPGGESARAVEAAEIKDAESIATQYPDMFVALEDGSIVSAHEALARADEVIAQAEHESKAFEAAVMCATRRGG